MRDSDVFCHADWRSQAMFACVLTLAVVVPGCNRAARTETSSAPATASPAGTPAASVSPAADAPADPRTIADAAALIARVAAAPEPAAFDVDKTAAGIASPDAAFAYVRDHVRTEIYGGVLRGAHGTLVAGAGNAWDQALLLAAILRHQGREIRFARAHLPPDAAATIVDRMFADAGRPRATVSQAWEVPASLQALGGATFAQFQANWQRAQGEVLDALDRAHLSLGEGATSRQTLVSEAADHGFVEYRDGDRWVAIDPIAAAAPGASAAPDDRDVFPDIPDALYHHVTVRVTLEERHDQQLERKEVLRYVTTAAALNGARVLLSHQFGQDVAAGWRATPLLQIDGHAYAARSFNETGVLAGKANSKEDLIGQAHQAVGQLGQVTDAFGGDAKPAAPSQSHFAAEWLEVEFTDPSRHSDVVRRELIDRIGPVARANGTAASAPLTPLTVSNNVPLQLAGFYVCAFAAGPLDPGLPIRRLSSLGTLPDDLRARSSAPPAPGPQAADERARLMRILAQYPALLQASAESAIVMSQRLAQRLRGGESATLFYEATPRLVIASFDLSNGLALDLRRSSVRAVAGAGSAKGVVRASLSRSVADAAVEAMLMMPRAEPRRITALDVFDRARAQGIRLVAVRAGAPAVALQASEVARARMAAAQSTTILIAPERTPSANAAHFAWWQIDSGTGEAVTVLDTGLNGAQDIPEYQGTNAVSPVAYEVGPPRIISPMAYEVAAPRAQCVIFDGDMLLELIRAITATGG